MNIEKAKDWHKYKVGDKVVPHFMFFEDDSKDNFLVVDKVDLPEYSPVQLVYLKDFPLGRCNPVFNIDLSPYTK